ncbi:MAG: glycosyltransferase family 2 protein [Candidatus Undinarchaeales archaeon]|jgi:glycosyltransferase involved in cell wall biosynthesis|nr:glycosyltransferase family 2 protein [Candidatus Undinarchaeales archaeon]
MVELSIVVPAFNEAENIPLLYTELTDVLKGIGHSYEIVFVDDGSVDGSRDVLNELACKDPRVRALIFRTNFGQSAAMDAGFKEARGDIVITLDADLQNNPEDIPKILSKLSEGFDVVSGWRRDRRDPFLSKRVPSRLSNWLHSRLTGLDIHDSGCTLKGYSHDAIESLELYGEMHRFIPAILHSRGYRVAEVEVNHRPRQLGVTKYGLYRLINGFLDLLYITFWSTFSSRPLHLFGRLGFSLTIVGFLAGTLKLIHQMYVFFVLAEVVFIGPIQFISILLMTIGVLFICFGFLFEIQIRIFYRMTSVRNYSIRERIGPC